MHTKGEWRLHDMEDFTIVSGKPHGKEVANTVNGFGDRKANARLIASSPMLLSACEEAYESLLKDDNPMLYETLDKLRQAIKLTKEG